MRCNLPEVDDAARVPPALAAAGIREVDHTLRRSNGECSCSGSVVRPNVPGHPNCFRKRSGARGRSLAEICFYLAKNEVHWRGTPVGKRGLKACNSRQFDEMSESLTLSGRQCIQLSLQLDSKLTN